MTEQINVSAGRTSQDRVAVMATPASIIVVVADGAGGIGDGGTAASEVVAQVESLSEKGVDTSKADTWLRLLKSVDQRLYQTGVGQTTAIVLEMSALCVHGASVGDSEAWLVQPDRSTRLTAGQKRKPLLGDGMTMPIPFEASHENATLLVATDGLFKYTAGDKIRKVVCGDDLAESAAALVDLVRLPSGQLQDDVGIVLCRPGGPILAHRPTPP